MDSWTDRRRLQRQYGDPGNLAARVGVYDFLVPDQDIGDLTFEEWVLDHRRWDGTEAVLDVGRGAGAYEAALRRRAATTIGLDLSAGMLVAAAGGRPAPLVVGDAQALPVRDGAADVVLAAHMLFHVPDIGRALRELRRALRPGGTALLVANGADDKQEIRDLWQEAATAVTGLAFAVPSRPRRFTIGSVDAVAAVFADVRVDALTGWFRFPTPEPVVAWADSLRAGTEEDVEADVWDAVLAGLRARVEARIRRFGHFTARKSSGVILAR